MRTAATLLCAALIVSHARSEPLSAADREALIESLEALRESANERVDARFRSAINAYRQAMASNDAAIDFYLKCVEKVDYEDQKKKAAEFRDWKRREADHLSDANFRLALRYQLRWLVLALQAASEKADRTEIAVEARKILDALFQDIVKLQSQAQTLRQPVTSTVFARAYEISEAGGENLPLSPMQLEGIYNRVVFPQLRGPSHLDSLRTAWLKRIQQESIMVEAWEESGKGRKTPASPDQRSVNAGKFATETAPGLQWEMEMDLFKNGDESGAAKRMLDHIRKYITHKSARDWSEQFRNLLSPPAVPASTAAAESTPGA